MNNECVCPLRTQITGLSLASTISWAQEKYDNGENNWIDDANRAANHIQSGTRGTGGTVTDLDWYIDTYTNSSYPAMKEIGSILQKNLLTTCIGCGKPICD